MSGPRTSDIVNGGGGQSGWVRRHAERQSDGGSVNTDGRTDGRTDEQAGRQAGRV